MKSRSERLATLATAVAFFMIVLDTSIVNLAIPRIAHVFHAEIISLQWLVDGYALVFASLLLNMGALGDRFGAKRMFTLGLIIFSVASAVCGLAPGMASLQVARAIQGIGAAMLLPNSLAALNHSVRDPARRRTAVSTWAGAGGLGIAVGPVAGGALVQYLDWRAIFLVNVPIGLFGLWLARRHLASGTSHGAREFDPAGQVLAVAALAVLTDWMIGIGRPHASPFFAVAMGLAVVLLSLAFVVVEARQVRPMLPLDLLRRPQLSVVAVVGLLHNIGIYGLIFALSLAFQQLLEMRPIDAGLLFLPMTVMLALGAGIGPRLLRNTAPVSLLIWGHTAAAVGAVALFAIGFDRGVFRIAAPLCLIGFGGGITSPAMNLSALDAVERERSGIASGILNSARQTGGAVGVALLGTLIGEPVSASGARFAAIAAAVALASAAVLASLVVRKASPPARTPAEPS